MYFFVSAQNVSGRIYKKLEALVACGNGNGCLNSRVGGRLSSICCSTLCHMNVFQFQNNLFKLKIKNKQVNEIIGRPFFQYIKVPPDPKFCALAVLDYLQSSVNEMCSLRSLCIFWSRFHCLVQKPSVPTSGFRNPPSPPFSVRSSPTSLFSKTSHALPIIILSSGRQCLFTCRGRPSNLIFQ